jgi:ATP-dependent Clp protease ATP-binding subunit ClpA
MFERFTNRARHVVVLAQEEARRLQHNYIGTEHLLLGLLGEQGIASEALDRFGISLTSAREDVKTRIGLGKAQVSGHIPFTPRAKKTLELALREALQLHDNFIGTQHILLGVMNEGDGVGAQVLRQYADLTAIRMAVLDLVATAPVETGLGSRRWFRRRQATSPDVPAETRGLGEGAELNTTPAADKSLSEAARLAGSRPVGSHHLLLAAIDDPDSAAARALAAHGVDVDQVRAAAQAADIAGTSDEQPAEAGRRQLRISVSDQKLTVEATDPVLIALGHGAVRGLGDKADPAGTIPGDLPGSGSLSAVWQALYDSLTAIARQATAREASSGTEPRGTEPRGTESGGSGRS